jgi:Protein of unknown function (DUF669)
MTLAFEPFTEEEIRELNLLPDGIYDFSVKRSDEKLSKAGNQMLELILEVYDQKGKVHTIWDYIVPTSAMMYKLKHLCDSVGLSDKYKTGLLDYEDLQGKSGKAKIVIKKGNVNPNGGLYPDKNSVEDYVMTDKGALKYTPKNNDFEDDKDIPF